jgi:spore coat polysaccharide biosynthesis protein SpsF
VSDSRGYTTEHEAFWAGAFGTEYIARNAGADLLASNLHFFATALRHAGHVDSCLELGANIGMNLRALRLLYPRAVLRAVEINAQAAQQLGEAIGPANVWTGSLFEYPATDQFDLVLVKGVLIHLSPERLPDAYDQIHRAASRLILIGEYYNPSPVSIPYRGHVDRLFKRDFAGELLERFNDLRLVDYGFAYRRDPAFPQDDITWFLLQKSR